MGNPKLLADSSSDSTTRAIAHLNMNPSPRSLPLRVGPPGYLPRLPKQSRRLLLQRHRKPRPPQKPPPLRGLAPHGPYNPRLPLLRPGLYELPQRKLRPRQRPALARNHHQRSLPLLKMLLLSTLLQRLPLRLLPPQNLLQQSPYPRKFQRPRLLRRKLSSRRTTVLAQIPTRSSLTKALKRAPSKFHLSPLSSCRNLFPSLLIPQAILILTKMNLLILSLA
ncbi:hypothetical protein F5148DRAFT_561747 [Russula earlei]|uniref:Uncharacterized protein n=1 Tax=Russula earlei TaxID=71964 RepID=A0ACC0UPF6_9AGAM|nr:hypothetical protein F5148DRAFT_561747 [Russula earlei]